MINYSQNNEQLHIIRLLKEKRNGVFMDIGANDGVTLSNTYALARYFGWVGLLVEASPKAYERLLENYHKPEFRGRPFDFQNVAIGKEDGDLTFFESGELLKQGDIALVSSSVPYELKRWESMNMPFEQMQVPMTSVATMLSRSRHTRFDFLSLDIEGMELDVLPQIDFVSLGIKVACIEWNGKHKREFDNIMQKQGFGLRHSNQENLIYSK